jgi:hypothetical protein
MNRAEQISEKNLKNKNGKNYLTDSSNNVSEQG